MWRATQVSSLQSIIPLFILAVVWQDKCYSLETCAESESTICMKKSAWRHVYGKANARKLKTETVGIYVLSVRFDKNISGWIKASLLLNLISVQKVGGWLKVTWIQELHLAAKCRCRLATPALRCTVCVLYLPHYSSIIYHHHESNNCQCIHHSISDHGPPCQWDYLEKRDIFNNWD